jgi:competence protein ComEA
MNLIKTILAAVLALLTAAAFAAVDVNKATQAELESIKGIGPAMSTRILDARKSGGEFKDWADMQARVKGVRDRKSAKLSADGLTVNGAAYAATTLADAGTRPGKSSKAAKASAGDTGKK